MIDQILIENIILIFSDYSVSISVKTSEQKLKSTYLSIMSVFLIKHSCV